MRLSVPHPIKINHARTSTLVIRTFFTRQKFTLKPQALAEVMQTFLSNPPLAHTLCWYASEVFPFQFSPTSSEPQESTSGKKTA